MTNKKLSKKEVQNLVFDWLCSENQENDDNPQGNENYIALADSCRYSIIYNYTPDCPGTCGTIITVVFGYVGTITNFLVDGGKLKVITQDEM